MKEENLKNYVVVKRGKRMFKLFTSDLRKIYKIQRKVMPKLPTFLRVTKALPSTDVEENTE
jgi:hypothetical protein